MMRAAAAVAVLALLAGCATRPGSVTHVPVPVACAEPVPERPLMPTETLAPGVDLFVFTTHAQAEIEVREAYEKRLLLALSECRKPVASP